MKKWIKYFVMCLSLTIFITATSLIGLHQSANNYSSEIINIDTYSEQLNLSSSLSKRSFLEPVLMLAAVKEFPKESGLYSVYSSATGFGIKYDRKKGISYVLTNQHFCVDLNHNSELKIIGKDALDGEFSIDPSAGSIDFELVGMEEGYDLCLLKTKNFVRPVKMAKQNVELDMLEQLFFVGAPKGNFPIIVETFFSGAIKRDTIGGPPIITEISDNNFIAISAQVFGGQSGSPLFNKEGKVVGIIFIGLVDQAFPPAFPRHPTYGGAAIPIKDVYRFLKEYDI